MEKVTLPPRPGETGRPPAWDVTTKVGRWLAWRDRKVRAGKWDSSRHHHSWDRMFPFDPLRPVPDADQQRRNVLIREKRNAFYAKDCGTQTAITEGTQAVKLHGQAQLSNTPEPAPEDVEPKWKDSAVSGLGLKRPIQPYCFFYEGASRDSIGKTEIDP